MHAGILPSNFPFHDIGKAVVAKRKLLPVEQAGDDRLHGQRAGAARVNKPVDRARSRVRQLAEIGKIGTSDSTVERH